MNIKKYNKINSINLTLNEFFKKKYLLTNNLYNDLEGLWSFTLENDANKISKIILNEFGSNSIIIDNTAGLGGNTISFSYYFKYVISIEYDNNRFNLLKNNINYLNLSNIYLINDNCINIFNKNFMNNKIFIYFFDPPWGGPNYKKLTNLKLNLSSYTLKNIISLIKHNSNNKKSIIFKLPKNYDLSEFSKYNYKIYKINNYLLIIIYC
jgi:16S rRNA G966 N2-methylase RsmD